MTHFTLSDIYIYPVKSLAGISVRHWPVTKTGLLHDRKWMLIDKDRQFLSQRKLPRMALIKTALAENDLVLSAPGMENLILPLTPEGGEIIDSTIWRDQCDARSVSPKADQWLSRFLNIDCRLVYQPDDEIRRVDPNYAQTTDQVSFADGFPFLIISENSLASLNREMGLDFPITRFRPNLVIAGCPAYAEDSWREIRIGAIDFRLPKPCSRCSVPTIDPETAQTGKEPLITLNRVRKWQNKVYFGQNALHDQCGVLTVGDIVQVKSTGPSQPPI
ncbi:MOSC N-terminal beta barrel domain-containing protein [Methylobacter sp. Wu1]|uniref:MOSC domain-containing protein n=1 Tax=Methylobacter sp. Wu1 TaxID=3119359 RepID=UPI002F95807B